MSDLVAHVSDPSLDECLALLEKTPAGGMIHLDHDAAHSFARCVRDLAAALEAATKDAERLDAFTAWADEGNAPAFVFDDDGRWAVSFQGGSPIPEEGGHKTPVSVWTLVQPEHWRDTPREAIDAAIAERGRGGAE